MNRDVNSLVSVIIPVKNTEMDLLGRCVKSILSQTFDNIEVIIVLNGNSAEYCKNVRQTIVGDNITICETESIGLSVARNKGMSLAKGAYIAFVDADDEVVPTFLENAMKVLCETGADVAVGGIQYRYDGYAWLLNYNGSCKKYQGTEVCGHLLTASNGPDGEINGYIFNSACGKLFRKSSLTGMRFEEKVFFYEDMLFMYFLAVRGVSFIVTPDVWYIYYQYSSSLIRNRNGQMLKSFRIILQEIHDSIVEQGIQKELSDSFCVFVLFCIRFAAGRANDFSQFEEFVQSCKRLRLFQGSNAKLRNKKDKLVLCCVKHRLYKILYSAYAVRRFLLRIKPQGQKKEKLISYNTVRKL